MTELEALQQKHREEAAQKRAKLKERKQRTHRLIERGAILESAINEICPADKFSNEDIQKIVYYAILAPSTIDYIAKMGV
ncbi:MULTISPECIES: DUF3847 domain-containing protein [Lachnospiraceae]|jgi:hypothetical protein|uniref:DUF3847 domain-containing protein n=1 Tax=Lachnospiraceae TaxID=186803 RepID=UPI000E53EBA3|nr:MULTISPECIES: DUF3847 domain-containing protein [Lachnospiraceae]MDB2010811.1 DUF3847 domain-containing protein [[Clostridium] symbiosum]MDB2026897.1 DUF3847 domain-containing protein [[Clostridium] symbiosum]RHR44639.1 DUF3847 domain-containing protein [Clostridium sp. AF18-27]